MDKTSDKPSEWQPSFWKQRRNQVAFLAFFGFFNVFLLRVNLSVSIVAMSTALDLGTTNEFDWSMELRGAILSSFFYGYFFTQIIGGVLGAKFGGVRLIGISIFITGFLTVLTPVAARFSVFLVIGLRAIEGIFEGMTYPAIYAVWSRWAPPDECTRLGSFALSGSYLGTVVGYPMCGWLAENFGWPSTFYVPGCISIMWCVIWLTCVAESPINDKFITKQELKYIVDSIGPTSDKKNCISKYPWKDIFTSMPVWAIACAHFCENWGFYTLLTQLPSYMSEVLKFNIEKGSLLSATPYLVMTIILQTTGFFADWLRKKNVLTNTQIRKFFNCSAFLSQAVFMFLVGNSKNSVESIICLTLGVGLGAFAIPGFMVNPLDIAPQYASIVLGISNTIATIPGIISPMLTGFIVKNKTAEEWKLVFLISSGLYLFGAIFYAIFASGERQTWAIIVKADENNGVDGSHDNKTFAMKTS
ncbi:Major facilitator superfamily,Major facilitator superfamily domain [Cinara cedri]|uniref:Sialin n=1 Tax=Cinara cedri TaxID=506608 RepID=A0A5E4N9D2_9HEMI|nr:Major facilitator superfamily,Major facilitator superfamily domain [Cinara cedri]